MPTINVQRLDGTAHETVEGIRDDTSTRGVDLAGALIIATYTDGTFEERTWQAFDPYTFGGVIGTDFDMEFGFEVHELSTTKRLESLRMDLVPASSVFDTTLAMDNDPMGGSTPTSNNGFPFEVAPEYDSLSGSIDVSYSNIVNLVGSAAVGDLYTTMTIDFSGLAGGGLLGDLNWNTDMDTMRTAGDLMPVRWNFGDAGDDAITGTSGNDNLVGFGGDDTLSGQDGDDQLSGGNDDDSLSGGNDNDRMYGNGGMDTMSGDAGQDTLFGGADDDDINAGSGDDSVLGQGGDDTILGEAGDDILRGGSGDDSIDGGADNDSLYGNGNDDTINGGGGDDFIQGNPGADDLSGGMGNDTLFSGVGSDRLDGGEGDDLMNGGVNDGARDTFVFLLGYDEDRINQFDQAGSDVLELDQALWFATNPNLTQQEVVDTFGSLNEAGTILTLNFGGTDILEVQNGGGIDMTTFGLDITFV